MSQIVRGYRTVYARPTRRIDVIQPLHIAQTQAWPPGWVPVLDRNALCGIRVDSVPPLKELAGPECATCSRCQSLYRQAG
jgi:hypothetical protein